jgi:hypothetical protein
MNKSYEIEYNDLDLWFDRKRVKDFIGELIHAGYSIYWNESVNHFIIAIRSGRRLIKLKFDRLESGYRLSGNYTLKDLKLAEMLDKMISNTKGNAVVKRFRDEIIRIDSIVSGELIESVEIDGDERKTLFSKPLPLPTSIIDLEQTYLSTKVEQRIPVLRHEIDQALEELIHLIEQNASEERRNEVITRLQELRKELLWTESYE